ncbi:phosphate ABC transporter permease subunit PstC [Natronoglycomyces albus]|uniref:Phosphate transport system permease protein n=1 Tax=Natronoglycomyces albus TaxID=2811108 RepID=A0A895XS85_9ACTN|nr:phosphate ABC transporter permease subunit PstC [Natronoglycomyces albus]QSB06075.1 phosphate ABC transporter permease subunit PstC [Natronoglycomyces albus]
MATNATKKPLPPLRDQLRGKGFSRLADPMFRGAVTIAGVSVLGLLGFMIVHTTAEAWPILSHEGVFGFLSGTHWQSGQHDAAHQEGVSGTYGALPFMYGTLITSLIAIVIALPLALASAIYITQIAPRKVRSTLSSAIEMLAAVPSIVYGLWGLLFFIPFVMRPFFFEPMERFLSPIPIIGPLFEGPVRLGSYMSLGVILAIMILPIITAICREVFSAAPLDEQQAAYGLGATRWEVIRKVLLPRSLSGITGGTMLGLGRALGETMAAAMLVGASQQMGLSLFTGGDTMAGHIANTFADATQETVTALMAIGVALFVFTTFINLAARLLVWRMGRITGDAAV